MTEQEKYMKAALKLAQKAADEGEVPVGAVVVCDGKIVGRGRNRRETKKNALHHAEIEAIEKACKKLGGWRLHRCDLYVTLEPCPMCAGALINSRMKTVYYGAPDPKAGSCGSLINLFALPYNHQPALVSGVLDAAVVEDEQIHLRCFESTHEMLLEQLSQHKLDMIISDCPIDSTQQEGLFSVKIGECGVSFWCINPPPEKPFPACLEERRLLVPGRRSMLGRKLLNWFNSQGLKVEILGEFDDAALMKAFGEAHNAIFVAPTLYVLDLYSDNKITEIGRVAVT